MGVTVTPSFAQLRNKPNTISGFGITDIASQNVAGANTVLGTADTLGYSTGGGVAYSGAGGPQVMGNPSTAAMISWHRAGAFAANFGLDTDNVLKIGGWSMGAVSYPMLYPNTPNAPGNAPVYGCRAWVNFSGQSMGIRASGNVSSITDNGVGDYTVNFSTAMPDANYAVGGTTSIPFPITQNSNILRVIDTGGNPSVYSVRLASSGGGATYDPQYMSVQIFR